MHHGTYAVNQTGSTWHTYTLNQSTWVCLKYSLEPGSILQGWAILEELYCNKILGRQNCRIGQNITLGELHWRELIKSTGGRERIGKPLNFQQ